MKKEMDRPGHSYTLRSYAILLVLLPLFVVLIAFLVTGALAFERILGDLLVDRQRQIAAATAGDISEALDDYGRFLETLAAEANTPGTSQERWTAVRESSADALEVFDLGVTVLEQDGSEAAFIPPNAEAPTPGIEYQEIFAEVRVAKAVVFSQLLYDPNSRAHFILVGAPILDEGRGFLGALIGAARARTAAFTTPIRRLKVGSDGVAYLVDRNGRVIFHPDESQIGEDYSVRPFYRQVIGDGEGGTLWGSPTRGRLIEGDASVAASGWTLIVQETWGSAAASAQGYILATIVAAVLTILFVTLISWQGLRRITVPIRLLGEQADRLTGGKSLEVFTRTGVRELDDLERSFDEMARQISTYRAGMHRYIEALNQSQENERRRIARELHDETVQNLLAVSRQLEMYQFSETEPLKKERLGELHNVLAEVLKGLRRISQDLRPLMLEDLGLVPALQALVRGLRAGPRGVPHTQFEVSGDQIELPVEHELALYRITQEALNNTRKHAEATGVQVKLSFLEERVVLEIEDNGKGFQVPASLTDFSQYGHFGLMGIQERVWALEGELSIQSGPGKGTRLRIQSPVTLQHNPA